MARTVAVVVQEREGGEEKLQTVKMKRKAELEQGLAHVENGESKEIQNGSHVPKPRKKPRKGKKHEAGEDRAAEEPRVENKTADVVSARGDDEKVVEKKKERRRRKEKQNGGGDVQGAAARASCTPSGGKGKDDAFVSVSGSGSEGVKPYASFDEAKVAKNIMDCCKGFEKPSPIQSYAWPFLLAARDFIGIAATGSGKTLAFGVPAMDHVLKKGTGYAQNKPLCLVLAPTRELCQQIAAVLDAAGRVCQVKVACVYGGASKGSQIKALRDGATVVVATPGRLQDLVQEGRCSLEQVSFVVLDEADRMLDLGFEPAIRAIVGMTSKLRQTVMFSATWPLVVDQLAREFMEDPSPIKVMIGSQDLSANHDVTQIVEVLDSNARDARLESILHRYHKSRKNRIIVFVLYKKEAARVEAFLHRKNWKVAAIHGDKDQQGRNRVVASFKDGTCPLLIATDVAARGLDIPDVEYVINYSFPLTTEDYVHRIGRTGRAGRKGTAHTFFTHADKGRAGELMNVLREAGQAIPEELLKFGTHVKKKESKLYGAHFKEITADAPKASRITFDSDDE